MARLTRRQFGTLAAASGVFLAAPELLAQTSVAVDDLKPGEWAWYPERATSGPVAVVVSLADQLAFVYRNGIRIGVSTVSSGRKGYGTPVGVFTVLIKEKMHYSRKYGNAPMPDSQFFFGGAALHAGGLPGYPSSHGCVHLPREFADRLFAITHNGTPVIVTHDRSAVGSLQHTGLVMSEADLQLIEKITGNIQSKGLPTDSKGSNPDAFSILISAADERVYCMLNGDIIHEDIVKIDNSKWPIGTHAFVLHGQDPKTGKYDWLAVGLGAGHDKGVDQHSEIAATSRVHLTKKTLEIITRHLHQGSTYMLTDLPAHPSTRSEKDFVIMRDDKVS